MAERHPVDAVADDLILVYRRGSRRLEAIVRDGLRRGLDPRRLGGPDQRRGDATLAYRARQLAAARAILAELDRVGARAAPVIAQRAYASSILALDKVLGGDAALAGRFGGIHQRQVIALAGNLEQSIRSAVGTATANVEAVFARAAALDGALPPGGIEGLPRFIGRRQDDAWREFALQATAEGTVAGDVRRQISATLARRLIDDGVTDALTGFVDRAGRRWSLHTYTEMVARTLTREASSRALVGRMAEHGEDLVAITSHPHKEDVCTPYDGRTFSLSGRSSRYPRLDRMPPFHGRCRHAIGPAELLDEYERELGIQAGPPRPSGPPANAPNVAPPAPTPRPRSSVTARRDVPPPVAERAEVTGALLDPPRPPSPPFSPEARPRHRDDTLERLEAERTAALITGDPGPEEGAREAWEAAVELEDERDLRGRNKALNVSLGDEMAHFIDLAAGRKAGIRQRLLNGDMTIEEAEWWADEEYAKKAYRRAAREQAEDERGFRRRHTPCFVCGRFKRRPADVCDYCGDDPVSVDTGSIDRRASEEAFNRSYGYAY
jgi:hypothetical protein